MLTFLSTVEICLSTILKGLSKYRVTDGDKMKTDSIKNLYLKVPTPTFTFFWLQRKYQIHKKLGWNLKANKVIIWLLIKH